MTTTFTDAENRRYGRDVVLPEAGEAVRVTTSGDWPTVEGRLNLSGAQRRRASTAKGELLHRPDYGGDIPLFIEDIASAERMSALANSIRTNALRDDRIRLAQVSVKRGHPNDENADGVTIDLRVQPQEDLVEHITVVA